jgi:hypothetical protein
MSDTRYNGWTNYETWNLALWLGNDQGSDEYWREQTLEAWNQTSESDTKESRMDDVAYALADQLQRETEDGAPEVNGFYADVLSASIRSVNFREIAEHWLEDMADELPTPEGEE